MKRAIRIGAVNYLNTKPLIYQREQLAPELEPYFIRPVSHLAEEEAYTVFCMESPLVASKTDPDVFRGGA